MKMMGFMLLENLRGLWKNTRTILYIQIKKTKGIKKQKNYG